MTRTEYKEYLNAEIGEKLVIKKYMRPYEVHANYLIRAMQYYFDLECGGWIIKKIAHRYAMWCKGKLQTQYGIFISPETIIGKGLVLPHPEGIGKKAIIGENVTIYQQVTIGAKKAGGGYPIVKDGVVAYAGSKIIGDIVIESGTIVGANAVLNKSTKCEGIYVGVPAKRVE